MRFRQFNIQFAEETHPLYKDRAQFISASKLGRQQMEEQMAKERAQRQRRAKSGWSDV
jgi:glutathione-regulated potassium-efflux system ancillary protein KefC